MADIRWSELGKVNGIKIREAGADETLCFNRWRWKSKSDIAEHTANNNQPLLLADNYSSTQTHTIPSLPLSVYDVIRVPTGFQKAS